MTTQHTAPDHNQASNATPFIPADQNLPEITPKALILSILLVLILAATNAYLGLKVGVTISASIPAAVVSMGVLRLFRKSNILENNIVQTAASAGEAIVAGLSFVLPALIIIHFWQNFNYQETLWISLIGGILGVLFSIPVRRILLFHKDLRFPEGTAIGHVLKAGFNDDQQSDTIKQLIHGGLIGALINLGQAGFEILSSSYQYWYRTSQGILYGFGLGLDPALLAAGYIVGVNVAASTLIGVIIGWFAGIPVLSHFYPVPGGDTTSAAMTVWHDHIRYIGIGTMLVGGLWTLLVMLKPIYEGIRTSLLSMKTLRAGGYADIPRTERDIPMSYVLWITALLCIPLSLLIYHYANNPIWHLSMTLKITVVAATLFFTIFIGFIFTVLGAYFAGLIGSTNSPTSALALALLILMALLVMAILGRQLNLVSDPQQALVAVALVLMITALLSTASISNETIQDLKAGHIVGATPWKQQVMLIIGVIVASLLAPLVLQLLFEAYGMGGVFPRPGMDPSHMLAAPQAGMMAALAQGAFSYNLPWATLGAGAVIGALCILIDSLLRRHTQHLSLPVLAMGIGIYLPIESSMPFVIGGFASYFINRALKNRYPIKTDAHHADFVQQRQQQGLTLACGIVAGAALMGVILAIPFALAQSADVLRLVSDRFIPIANGLSIVVTLALLVWMYRVVCRKS